MKITLNIETQNPEDLMRVAQALAGVMDAPAATGKARGAAATQTARAMPGTRSENETRAEADPVPALSTVAPAAPVQASEPVAQAPAAASAPSPSEQVAVSEADITAAANSAAAALGASGPAKIKAHIGSKFTKIDGTPGTLKTTRPEQQAALLADLQAIARKELVL